MAEHRVVIEYNRPVETGNDLTGEHHICEYWIVQGLDVDYMADGETKEEAISNWLLGYAATCAEHIKTYGHLRHFLKPPPAGLYGVVGEETVIRE